MPVTSADAPSADKPTAKAKPEPAPSGLEAAMASSDPLVQKLLWDRGHRESSGDAAVVAAIDAELAKLGFDV